MKSLIYFVCALYYIIIDSISYVQCLQDVMLYRDYASDNMIWKNRTELSSVSKSHCALVVLKKNGSCFGFSFKTNTCYIKSNGEETESMNNVDVYCSEYSADVIDANGSVATTQLSSTAQTANNICRSPYTLQVTMKRPICYRIYTNSDQQWSDARSTCQNEGGDLLVVEDPNMLKFYNFSTDDQFFIGMYHIQPNDFQFVDGRTESDINVKHFFWKTDHPDLANDWCGYVEKSRPTRPIVWVSSPCTVNMSFICELRITET